MNCFSEKGATELADRIRAYWRRQGFTVTVKVKLLSPRHRAIWTVETDLVNGMPEARNRASRNAGKSTNGME